MNRATFLSRLRSGLAGAKPDQAADVMADYESHFSEGLAAGRSEDEISAALGDPDRLARELRAEAGFKRWEKERSAASLMGVVMAFLGLLTLDVIFMIPLLCLIAGLLIGFGAAAIGLFIGGCALLVLALVPGLAFFGMSGILGAPLALALAGIGLIAGGVGVMALTWLVLDIMARALVDYARLHFRLLDSTHQTRST